MQRLLNCLNGGRGQPQSSRRRGGRVLDTEVPGRLHPVA